MLPAILTAWLVLARSADRNRLAWTAGAMAVGLAAYFAIRGQTPSFTPSTAPWYYRPHASAAAANILQYLDRGATGAAAVTLVAAAIYRRRPALGLRERRLLAAAAVWFAAGFAVTGWIPVRSSLYAVFPSVGSALACAILFAAMRRARNEAAPDRRMAAALAALLLFVPVYRARNARYVEPSIVSARAVRALAADAGALPERGVIVFLDERAPFATFRNAFGALATEAVQLVTARPLDARVVGGTPEPDDQPYAERDVVARYQLSGGQVRRIQ